jgi:hypothetical protein
MKIGDAVSWVNIAKHQGVIKAFDLDGFLTIKPTNGEVCRVHYSDVNLINRPTWIIGMPEQRQYENLLLVNWNIGRPYSLVHRVFEDSRWGLEDDFNRSVCWDGSPDFNSIIKHMEV